MEQRETSGWAVGWTYFAGVLMIMLGIWHAIVGCLGDHEGQRARRG